MSFKIELLTRGHAMSNGWLDLKGVNNLQMKSKNAREIPVDGLVSQNLHHRLARHSLTPGICAGHGLIRHSTRARTRLTASEAFVLLEH
jgi:hypothetical protein